MSRNRNRKMVRYGFTMIELLVVLAILAIIAAVAVPMISSAGTMQLRSAVTMLAADLEYAKNMSISRGQRYAVVFNATSEQYWIVSGNQVGIENAIEHPVKKGFPYVVDFGADARLRQVEIVSASFDGASAVSFDYLGSPLSGNASTAPALNSQGVIRLQGGEVIRNVTVEPVTGYISVSN